MWFFVVIKLYHISGRNSSLFSIFRGYLELFLVDKVCCFKNTKTQKGVIHTDFGEDLSWDYLCFVREHPIQWSVPTSILYGNNDNLTSLEAVCAFAEQHDAVLTVMENGEHWFHTAEQMRFLDDWIRK